MRRKERRITDANKQNALLDSALYMTLATTGETGPYAVPLNFVYYNGALYFHCARQGTKLDNIRNTPRVCASIVGTARLVAPEGARGCDFSMAYESLTVTGIAEVVADAVEHLAALRALTEKHGGNGQEITETMSAAVSLVRITITSVTGKSANIS